MARLACQPCQATPAQHVEEAAGDLRLEGQAWRQLHQKHAQLFAETFDLPEKVLCQPLAIGEAMLMGHALRCLDRETEVLRHGVRPALIGLAAVQFVEGGVDFHDRKAFCVTFEMRPGLRKVSLVSRRNSPSGGAYQRSAISHAADLDRMKRGSRATRRRCSAGS
ncbi:hypothetical protein X773_22200 [Mesorhizobium sp. LSJC285A00]|nr:hypothetical protein X773_22200 [Mesorhizobium sp. LSJC285A00]